MPRIRFDQSLWILAGGFALLASLLVVAFTVSSIQERDQAWVVHTLQVQNRLADVMNDIQEAETSQRGYIITGSPAFLQPYSDSRAALSVELADLTRMTADNADQRASVSRMQGLVDERLRRLEDVLDARRTSDISTTAARLQQSDGQSVMRLIRAQVEEMDRREVRLLAERRAIAKRTADHMKIILVCGFVVLLALTVYAVRLSARRRALLEASREELIEANEQLILEAASRAAAELQARQLQKMESIGQLTGGIAHDFNNMLAIIIGSLDLAKRRRAKDPERADMAIQHALEGAERAAALTARLLAFSRQQPLAPVSTDPNRLIGGLSELLRRTIGEQTHLETVLAGGVWRINADNSQLENAIVNLCVNARDAMPDGGRLTIETANAYLDDAYAAGHNEVQPGQYVMISVSDSGAGMSPEVLQQAVDPFFTTKGVGRGTGLGLSQVFGFVKQSKGHMKIYSELGQGTVVKIYLPRWMGDEAELPSRPAKPQPEATGEETILVVEDDENLRRVSVEALQHLGYAVLEAGDPDQARAVLKRPERIDLLFTDIVMPGSTGRVLADHAMIDRPDLKVLYTTGYTRNAVVHNGVLDAGVAFLPKPFSVAQLAAKVRDVLDGHGANRQA